MGWVRDFKPTNYKFNPILSISKTFKDALIVLNLQEEQLKMGIEYYLSDNFNIRVGINEYKNSTIGFGLALNFVELNYAYFKLNEINEYIKQFSITLNLEKFKEIY